MRAQRTIKNEVSFEGIGLHTGKHARVTLKPASRDAGITFIRTDKPAVIKAHVGSVIDTAFATTLGHNGVKIKTVEHVLAALAGLGIDNLLIEVNGPEMPILDGSSTELISIILRAGIAKQGKKRPYLRINRPFVFEDGHAKIAVFPYSGSRITYSIFFHHHGIGEQRMSIDITEENFVREIAPARTFGFLKDIEMLERMGLAGGGRLHNFILVDDERVVNTELRFSDEFARHKVLDLIGDLYLLNRPVRGKVTAHLTGHTENIELLKKIQEESRDGDR